MRRSSIALSILLAACGSAAPSQEAPEHAQNPSESQVAYDVHEWGLVRAAEGDVLDIGAIGPPLRAMPLAVDKPVLYFHPEAALHLRSVVVRASGGEIVEAWPLPERSRERIVWRDVAIDPSGACEPSPLPMASDPACAGVPGVCETPSLATVRAPGSACVRVAGATDSFLFYRARSRAYTPPLRFARRGTRGEVDIVNDGDEAIPGWLVRMQNVGGLVSALAVRPPAPRRTITIGSDFAATDEAVTDHPVPVATNPNAGSRAVRDSLREIGMTDGEIDAFMRAWEPALFGAGGVDRGTIDVLTDGRFAPEDSFLYFLPASGCDRIAHLELDPPPRSVRRAIAVWTSLGRD